MFFFFLGEVFLHAQCGGGSQVGSVVTPSWESENGKEGIRASISNGNYVLVNVVKGIQYEVNAYNVRFCDGNREIDKDDSSLLGVKTTFTAPVSGQIRVYYTGLGSHINIKAVGKKNSIDTPDIPPFEKDKWRIHFYGEKSNLNPKPPGRDAKFENYLGYVDENESFDYVRRHNESTPINVFSEGEPRIGALRYFSTRSFMKSTRKGFYYVNLGADDGTRLSVDSKLVYDNWGNPEQFRWNEIRNQIVNLTGNSLLHYEYYNLNVPLKYLFTISNENRIIENTISGNQTLCIDKGNGEPITGDDFNNPRSQHNNYTPTFQFQWSYATTEGGVLIDLNGETQKDFTPNTKVAPFNQAGTYYVYRKASVTFKNVGISEKTETLISNPVKVTINALPTATFSGTDQTLCLDTPPAVVWRIGLQGKRPFVVEFRATEIGGESRNMQFELDADEVNLPLSHTPNKLGEYIYEVLSVTDGNGCKTEFKSEKITVTVVAPRINQPQEVVWCLPSINQATYQNDDTIIRENYYGYQRGTELDVQVNSVPCCPNPTLKWKINELPEVGEQTGQPSNYTKEIRFENNTNSDKTYTITYWLECNGQKYSEVTRQIRITPRPRLEFQ